jgi:Domain of unknown function (DUF4157)
MTNHQLMTSFVDFFQSDNLAYCFRSGLSDLNRIKSRGGLLMLRERIQRQRNTGDLSGSSFDVQPRLEQAVSRGGQPLDAVTRNFLEPKFGQNFENVQIHADGEADMLSQEFGARAFATGENIFFKAGQFDPTSSNGLHLLAHELTHTVQQRLTSSRLDRAVSDRGDSAEGAARATADAVMAGQAVGVAPSASAVISRNDDDLFCAPTSQPQSSEVGTEDSLVCMQPSPSGANSPAAQTNSTSTVSTDISSHTNEGHSSAPHSDTTTTAIDLFSTANDLAGVASHAIEHSPAHRVLDTVLAPYNAIHGLHEMHEVIERQENENQAERLQSDVDLAESALTAASGVAGTTALAARFLNLVEAAGLPAAVASPLAGTGLIAGLAGASAVAGVGAGSLLVGSELVEHTDVEDNVANYMEMTGGNLTPLTTLIGVEDWMTFGIPSALGNWLGGFGGPEYLHEPEETHLSPENMLTNEIKNLYLPH